MNGFSQMTPDTIRKHQANTSTAKQAFRFSRSQRFISPNPECKQAFYAYTSYLSKRKTSLGYGKRCDFTQSKTSSPASTKYLHKSVFQQNKNRGSTFGLSRNQSPERSYIPTHIHKLPAPGQYDNSVKPKMTISHSYSMRQKLKDFVGDKFSYKNNPGPGAYNEIQLLPKTGRFKISKYSDSKNGKINEKTCRFRNEKDSPSPLSYREGDNFSDRGKYILSHRKGKGTRPFNQEVKKTFTDIYKKNKICLPGPGTYDRPSDFGVYGQHGDERMKATIG